MTHEMDFGRQVRESGAYFLEGLRDLQKRHREIGDVDGLAWRCAPRSAPRTASRPTRRCWTRWSTSAAGDLDFQGGKRGLVLDVGGYYKNVITFAPSLMISRSEIDEAMALLDQLISRAKRA